MVLADADKEGVDLWLGINPSGDLSYGDLDAWYKRHGFKEGPYGYLVRPAQS